MDWVGGAAVQDRKRTAVDFPPFALNVFGLTID